MEVKQEEKETQGRWNWRKDKRERNYMKMRKEGKMNRSRKKENGENFKFERIAIPPRLC